MKVDMSQVLKNLKGEAFKEDGDKDLNLRSVTCMALLTQQPQEKQTGEEKVKLYDIAMKVHKCGKEIDLKIEEVALIKQRIGNQYAPLIVGQAWLMLEKGSVSTD